MKISKYISEDTLKVISKKCPTALGTYLHVIRRANNLKYANFSKKEIEKKFRLSWRKFRADIIKLVLYRIFKWHPSNVGISVTVVHQ